MTKNVFRTLSLSALSLAIAAGAPAAGTAAPGRVIPADPERAACSTEEAIDLGWAYQRGLLEGRLEAKGPVSLEIKGAIVSPLFPRYAPYRKELPTTRDALAGSNDPGRGGHRPSAHDASVERP